MFKFNTTTIINSNEDFTTGLTLFEGDNGVLSVKRGLNFKKKYVRAIYKRAYNDPELAQVDVDLSAVDKTGVWRLAMYIRLQGSENEYFANDYVFKGKPFYIEFVAKDGETATDLGEKIVKIAKKYMQMVYELPLIEVIDNEDGTLTFKATDEYQRFAKFELQYFDDNVGLTNGCCEHAGDWTVIEKLDITASPTNTSGDKITWGVDEEDSHLLKGKEGFGTYRNLVKNLRLPTADNLRWGHILQDEVPVPGATYDQYTIWYCRKVGVQGLDAVGDIVQSLTSHIFFVNSCVSDAWEAAIAEIGTPVDVEDDNGVSKPVATVEDLWEQNSQPEEEEQQGGAG